MKLSVLTLLLSLTLFVGCSDDSSKGALEKAGDNVGEAVDDIQQEACETVDGKVECAAERAREDIEDATGY